MKPDNNQQVFIELVKAGLWGGSNANLNLYEKVDWGKVYQLAQEQSVQGLVLQGLEWFIEQGTISKTDIPQGLLLQWIGEVKIIEQRNRAMNAFVADLIEKLRDADIYTLLVKGQGIAQCYDKPLWRVCGDVDLLLSPSNYNKSKNYLMPQASSIDEEDNKRKHLSMTVNSWIVELHGTLDSNVSHRIDQGLNDILWDLFGRGNVRSWMNGNTPVFLPNANNDVIIIFTHILQHFFNGGIGLRQICDWCRLLWTYRENINLSLLQSRLLKMGIMNHWQAFAALAVNTLGMPEETIPFYSSKTKWSNKSNRIFALIMDTGNFGQRRDDSYKKQNTFITRLCISFGRHTKDFFCQFMIFPKDAIGAWLKMLEKGIVFAAKGE